ncbi:MAG TPA: hypothetical protein VEZ40_02780 [Pyrinomonadaceae bacterium]|nr:hypothetical protein [Pyrinomonadaceae bacterium]
MSEKKPPPPRILSKVKTQPDIDLTNGEMLTPGTLLLPAPTEVSGLTDAEFRVLNKRASNMTEADKQTLNEVLIKLAAQRPELIPLETLLAELQREVQPVNPEPPNNRGRRIVIPPETPPNPAWSRQEPEPASDHSRKLSTPLDSKAGMTEPIE